MSETPKERQEPPEEPDDLTAEQVSELRDLLRGKKSELEQMLQMTRAATKPVDLDEPIGRLTRMDAIQQQSVTAANRREHDLRLRQVLQALGDIEKERYGECRRCEDPIGYPRLKARPESPYCIECQDAIDRKHS